MAWKGAIAKETAGAIASVAVVDTEGTRQVVRLKEPLMLPPAA